MNKEMIKEIIYIVIAIILSILAVKFMIWLLPVILVVMLSLIIYSNIKMNKNLKAINGDVLSISQFTLYANNKNGNRPSFTEALDFDNAYNLYNKFNEILEKEYGLKVEKGTFGADMKVTFTNDGPVTIILDSNNI